MTAPHTNWTADSHVLTTLTRNLCRSIAEVLAVECPPGYTVRPYPPDALDQADEVRPDIAVVPITDAGLSQQSRDTPPLVVDVVSKPLNFTSMVAKEKTYAHAGIPTCWIIDSGEESLFLVERLLGQDGDYHYGEATSEIYTTDRPWKVTLDLPALSARHKAMREHANAADNE